MTAEKKRGDLEYRTFGRWRTGRSFERGKTPLTAFEMQLYSVSRSTSVKKLFSLQDLHKGDKE